MEDDGFVLVSKRKCAKEKRLKSSQIKMNCIIDGDVDYACKKVETLKDTLSCEEDIADFLSTVKQEVSQKLKPFQRLSLVCYGLGKVSFCRIAQIQFSFFLLLRDLLGVDAEAYDPIFSTADITLLKDFKVNILNINEKAKRTVKDELIFFYMPHCDYSLYNNLLWANWSEKSLNNIVLLGNSFKSAINDHISKRFIHKYQYIAMAEQFCIEHAFPVLKTNYDCFNNLSLIILTDCIHLVDKSVWSVLAEPEYSDDEKSIKKWFFTLNETECHPLLECHDISKLTLGALVGFGAVKKVYLSTWQIFPIAVVFNNNPEYLADFHRGLDLLIRLGVSKYITSLIGHCKESNVYLTKYYPLGSLLQFEEHLPPDPEVNFKTRFKLCLSYIEIIEFVHSVFDYPAVMCDSNTLNKTLEQYLLRDGESLVLNDIDALTEVKSEGLICGHKEITGDFVAPEQLWTFEGTYDHKRMSHYNEKTDIWKIPAVCKRLLGRSRAARAVKYHLFEINKACHSINPNLRPNASLVLKSYLGVFNLLFNVKDEL